MESEFTQKLTELLEAPISRASLDLSIWMANHSPDLENGEILLMLTGMLSEIVKRTTSEEDHRVIFEALRDELEFLLFGNEEKEPIEDKPKLKVLKFLREEDDK
jgi:hypothetical protein